MSLTTDSFTTAAGETHLKGASIHTTTDAVFNDIVKIFTDVRVTAAGQLNFTKTIDGDTPGTRSLTLDGGNIAAINVDGAVGETNPLKTLEVVNSEFTTFTGPVTTSTSVVLSDTQHTIAFYGGLTTPTLTVAAQPFNLILRANVAVTNAVILANTGSVQLGGVESDDMHFAGGLVATAPSALSVAGILRSTDQAIVLGRSDTTITLVNDTWINSGAGSLRLASSVTAGEEAYVLRLLSTGPTTIDGDLTSRGALSLIGPVTFSRASTITTPSMTFGGTVTAQGNLTIHGATIINGGSVNSGAFTQTYDGAVDIGGYVHRCGHYLWQHARCDQPCVGLRQRCHHLHRRDWPHTRTSSL
jgi:hypothetical protein